MNTFELYKAKLQAVYDKSSSSLNIKNEGAAEKGEKQNTTNVHDGYLLGETSEKIILENHHQFLVDWVHGQKTGFFIDQRDNRRLLADYSHGKKVLNTFCYSGGFSVYAAKAGARKVDSVDSSAKAIEWTNENIKLNKPASTEFQSYVSDVFDFLKNADNDYDVIILDPPAFAKGLSARHAAITAYGRLNLLAFKKIKPGGIVFAFSCSQVISQGLFTGAVTAAAIESGRKIRILHHLTQPADHPVSIYHPEGLYLKGLVLAVD